MTHDKREKEVYQPAGVALAEAVGAARGLRILDVACGPGLASREALGRGAEVVGVDISEAMVAVASRNVPGGTFHQAPAEELPFADGSFDGVMCGFGLPHFADPEAVFTEVFRVLKYSGKAAFTTWDKPDPDRGSFPDIVLAALAQHGSLDVAMPEAPNYFRFAAEQAAIETLGDLGFVDVSVTKLPLEVTLDDPALAIHFFTRATVRLRVLFEAQTAEAKAAIAKFVVDSVEKTRKSDGRYSVTMPAVLITGARP